jgi:PAS domain S-box-containing protein
MKRQGIRTGSKDTPNPEIQEQLKLLAGASLRINQMETSTEVAEFVCQQVKAIIGQGYAMTSLLDDVTQTIGIKAIQGLQDDELISKIIRLTGMDLRKMQVSVKNMTPEELATFRSGHLQLLENGIFALTTRKFPKAICTAIEHLLHIRFVYTMGFVHRDYHLGGVIIMTDSKNLVEANRFIIENIIAQAAVIISRMHAEEALKDREHLYRLLTEDIKDVVWILDAETMRFQYVSPSVERLSGYTPQEVLAQSVTHSFAFGETDDMVNLVRCRVKDLLSGKEPTDKYYMEVVEQPCKNRSSVWTEVISSYYINPNNSRVEIRGVTRDITERKKAESALYESEEKYRSLVKYAPVAIYEMDLQGTKFFSVNDIMPDMVGYSVDELLSLRPVDLLDEDSKTRFKERIRSKLAGEPVDATVEYRIRRKDDTWITTSNVAHFSCTDENPPRVAVIGYDITERKKTEEALRESEEKWRGLFAILPVGISILNGNLAVTDSNPALDRILEIPPVGSVEAPYSRRKYLRGDGTPMPPGEFPSERAVREQMVIPSTEIGVLREDGTVIWTELISAPLPKSGCVNVITDITERKRQEKMLQDALEEKDVLLREITHRVKNNLAAVIGLMNMRARSSSHPAVQGMVQDLTGHIRSMALAHEMLLHSGTYKYIKMDNYLETLLADVPRFFEREHPITVTVTVDDTRLDMDTAVPVGMLASELVTNALKHAFPEGKNNLGGDECAISVSLKQSDGLVLLVVADNGVGLPRGFDCKNTASMGMHLLHMLGEHQLRGIIEIDSTHGTTFKLNFPFILRKEG